MNPIEALKKLADESEPRVCCANCKYLVKEICTGLVNNWIVYSDDHFCADFESKPTTQN